MSVQGVLVGEGACQRPDMDLMGACVNQGAACGSGATAGGHDIVYERDGESCHGRDALKGAAQVAFPLCAFQPLLACRGMLA